MDPTDFRPHTGGSGRRAGDDGRGDRHRRGEPVHDSRQSDWINGVTMSSARSDPGDQLLRRAPDRLFPAHLGRAAGRGLERGDPPHRCRDRRGFRARGAAERVGEQHAAAAARARARPPSDHVRPNYMALGPADVSGASRPGSPGIRRPGALRDRDAGPPDPGFGDRVAEGSYFGYDKPQSFRRAGARTAGRSTTTTATGLGDSWHVGQQVTIGRTEMDLLKAEALIRLNRAERRSHSST
jgi:hypothetical protein